MKLIIAVLSLSLVVVASGEFCYTSAKKACAVDDSKGLNCTAKFGQAHNYLKELEIYANIHITRSFQYLLMSSYFGNYQTHREGFKKLYRKLSDAMWEDAIDTIKYITMRGGKMDFHYDEDIKNIHREVVEMSELESLAKSVDIQKKLAVKAHQIYKDVHNHDPEVSAFVEDKFMHKHAKQVRELAGHTNDLARLIKGQNRPTVGMEVFIFDTYLEKTV